MATEESTLATSAKESARGRSGGRAATTTSLARLLYPVVRYSKSYREVAVLALYLVSPLLLVVAIKWSTDFLPYGPWTRLFSWLPRYQHGGSWLGLLYGAAGFLLILVLMYYSVRKRTYTGIQGRLSTWLRSHKGLGCLVVAIVLCHTGLRFSDPIAVMALVFLGLVAVSGITGAWLFCDVPGQMISVPGTPTLERLSTEINQLASSIRELGNGRSPEFNDLCSRLIAAATGAPKGSLWRLLCASYRTKFIAPVTMKKIMTAPLSLPPSELQPVQTLFELAGRMKSRFDQLIIKQTYMNLMSVWLYVHVPLSVVMLAWIVFHMIVAVSYLSWDNVLGFHR